MADKTIRISEENWRRLAELKEEGDSFDDVVTRLTTSDRWSGFGALDRTGVADEMQDAHERLSDEFRRRVDDST